MKKLLLILIAFIGLSVCIISKVNAQGVGINPSGNNPDPSALLDLSSTNKGALVPRMTMLQRNSIVSPAKGLIIYNTDCDNLNCNSGTPSTPNWVFVYPSVSFPSTPTEGTHTPSTTQIVWNWNTVSGADGYKYNTTNNYSMAINNGTNISYTQTGLTCNTAYALYVWAYNACGNSTVATLTQSTSACPFICGTSQLTDSRDGQSYNTVQIGTQCWMKQNLNYGTYVPVSNGGQVASGTQKYCKNLSNANDNTCPFGGLYEWTEMMNGSSSCNGTGAPPNDKCTTPIQGICPTGWHLPSHYEWTTLEKNVGSNPGAFAYDGTTTGFSGTNEGGNMKVTPICGSLPCWASPNTGATNSSGFSGLPGGSTWQGAFYDTPGSGDWWIATEFDATRAWERHLGSGFANIERYYTSKLAGLAVRCLKDF